jgi:two-component system, response regulator RegA
VLSTAHQHSGASQSPDRPASPAGADVLLADDDGIWLQQVKDLFSATGGRVRVATDGIEWLKAIRGASFDLVVVEPNLPGRLWYALIHDVRVHLPGARLVITTAFPSRALARVARSLGADAVLSKPVRIDRLAEVLRGPPAAEPSPFPREGRPRSLARLEWEYINHMLQRCHGNMTAASRELKVPRQTLYRKLRKHPPPA